MGTIEAGGVAAAKAALNKQNIVTARMRFISARVVSFTTRGPLTYSPYSAVLEIAKFIRAMPLSYMRSTMSFSSCRHSK